MITKAATISTPAATSRKILFSIAVDYITFPGLCYHPAMKNFLRLALAILLLGSASAARAAARPEDNHAYAIVDKALDDLALQIDEVKKCAAQTDALKADFAQTKADIAAENGGVIPSAFDDALAAKKDRFTRGAEACMALDKGLAGNFDQAHAMIRSVEPRNGPGIAKRRERLKSLNALSNSILKRLK